MRTVTLGGLTVSAQGLGEGIDIGVAPTWSALAFALPVAMLAYTGLETVANLAAETREPGRTLPRSLFAGIGVTVLVSFGIAIVGLSAFPPHPDSSGPGGYASDLGTGWLRAPLVGIADAFAGHISHGYVDAVRVLPVRLSAGSFSFSKRISDSCLGELMLNDSPASSKICALRVASSRSTCWDCPPSVLASMRTPARSIATSTGMSGRSRSR